MIRREACFHDHQYVEDSKARTRYYEEVAGDDGRGMVLKKGRPTLIATAITAGCARRFGQIFPDCARRHAQAEFHQQLVGNSLLAPGGILARHRADQPFAERICLRAAYRCFDDFKAHVRYRSIELGGEDRVAVMQDKPVRVI